MISRGLTCGLFGVLLATGPGSVRAQDAPPELIPPVLEAPATGPATRPAEKSTAKPVQPSNPSLLLIPGVTVPAPPRRDFRAPRPGVERVPLDVPAPAAGPAATRPGPAATRPAPNVLTLEPITEDLDDEPAEEAPPQASRPQAARPSTASPSGRPAPGRGTPNVLGRFLGPTGATGDGGPGSAITVEPRSDPAADAAVKRRIEKQIEQSLGSRVRTVEVRVTGRAVLVRAKASRFWQRRSIRQSLETIPLPAGYRVRVEMID